VRSTDDFLVSTTATHIYLLVKMSNDLAWLGLACIFVNIIDRFDIGMNGTVLQITTAVGCSRVARHDRPLLYFWNDAEATATLSFKP